MGVSVTAYWPGITEEQFDSQPGFWNDDKGWGDFMADREDEPDVKRIIAELGAAPILTNTTDGVSDDEVYWVTPRQLYDAAARLIEAVKSKQPGIERVLAVYERNANKLHPVEEEFMQDLLDIQNIASFAEREGTGLMTLEVNW
jgi:hypothetical protein